jgi:cyclopropane-fatty-acyl-phospholipid synthase
MNSITTTLDFQDYPVGLRSLLATLGKIAVGTLELTTPEGRRLTFGNGEEPRADARLTDWSALRKVFRKSDIGLAECYRDGLVETSDIAALLDLGNRNRRVLERIIKGNRLLNLGYRIQHLLRRNTRKGSSKNIQAHYDLGNEFYELWLDPSMTYSSARFEDGLNGELTQAQDLKYQRMLDRIQAKPGDKVLEIGCGWGGFAEYAAGRGIGVHGVTLSRRQLEYARRRIAEAGLDALASFELMDYRDLDGQYDHIVSIEMLEAVGEAYWPVYFEKLGQLLKPGGRVAIQAIVIDDACFESYRKKTDFIQQYIFPGGMLPSLGKLSKLVDQQGFKLQESEAFGRDYAETLRRWRSNFENNLGRVREQGFDNAFIRLWRFYLAFCEVGFDEQRIDVVQFSLCRESVRC